MVTNTFDDLDRLNFSDILQNGFIFKDPADNGVWLGVLEEGTPSDYDVFTSNFYHKNQNYLKFQSVHHIDTQAFIEFLNHKDKEFSLTPQINTDEAYIEDVTQAIARIKNSESLEKLVCVSRAEYRMGDVHPLFCFEKLSKLEGYVYGLWGSNIKNVIGVSPEQLFIRKGKEFQTVALAGTISTKVENYKKVILDDVKEREEHQLVISDLVTKLDSLGVGIELSETGVKIYGDLAHLETKISFHSDSDPIKLLKILSPTAALGGYPTQKALGELKQHSYFELEEEERNFGGIYSFTLDGLERAIVGIRNIYWEKDKVFLHSGSGIVKDSDPVKELSEIQNKREAVVRAFNG